MSSSRKVSSPPVIIKLKELLLGHLKHHQNSGFVKNGDSAEVLYDQKLKGTDSGQKMPVTPGKVYNWDHHHHWYYEENHCKCPWEM